jgi:hypothetical protein
LEDIYIVGLNIGTIENCYVTGDDGVGGNQNPTVRQSNLFAVFAPLWDECFIDSHMRRLSFLASFERGFLHKNQLSFIF